MRGSTIWAKWLTVVLLGVSLFTTGCATRIESVVKVAAKSYWQETREIPLPTGNFDVAVADLANRIRSFGITVAFGELPEEMVKKFPGLRGLSNATTGVILVDGNLPSALKLHVLAHEIAHFFHYHGDTTSQNEVFAELVAMEISAYYKLDTRKQSANYLSRYKSDLHSAKTRAHEIQLAIDVSTGQRQFQPHMISVNWK
jgi:hypothetical protein